MFQHDNTLNSLITQPVDRDSEEEIFKDLDSSNEDSHNDTPQNATSSAPRYNFSCRNPLYSHADYSCVWELSLVGSSGELFPVSLTAILLIVD